MDQRISPPHYEFSGFRLDTNLQMLVPAEGNPVQLTSKAFQTLLHLVEHAGEVVDKRSLMNAVWPNVVVEENNLNQCIGAIRRALGETAADRRFLLTIPGRGFKFVAPVRVVRENLEALAPGDITRQQRAPVRRHHLAGLRHPVSLLAVGIVGLAAIGTWVLVSLRSPVTRPSEYEQLTDVAEAVSAPTLSRDGRMLAYILGADQFMGQGQLYIKLLPAGDPVQLTHVKGSIYAPAFSPDGARIAYTHIGEGTEPVEWETQTVPVMGGTAAQLLPNSSGLTWIAPGRVMYSEVKSGIHLGIVSSAESRAGHHGIYLPAHERGMAHFSFLSPDGRSVLIAEMSARGVFERCRLVPFDGRSSGSLVGPAGTCLSAAWSPDGKWMYFSVRIGRYSHLWRQRFPNGEAQQITFGPTKETGVVAAPDGHSLITSLGSELSSVWMHDASGERRVTAETTAWQPWLSADAARLYYLRLQANAESPIELALTNLRTHEAHVVLPGFEIQTYDVSADEREIVFSILDGSEPQIWLARIDRATPPRLLARGADQAVFGGAGSIFYRQVGAQHNFLFCMDLEGGHIERLLPSPIFDLQGASPDGRLVTVGIEVDGHAGTGIFRAHDATAVWTHRGYGAARWSPDGRTFYFEPGWHDSGPQIIAKPVHDAGVPADPSSLTVDATQIPHSLQTFFPGADPATYAFVSSEKRRNIFRIPLH